MYKVNVLMSTYNGETHLGEQIDSIMNQKDVEVILTIRDDGSSDGTLAVIKKYINKYGKKIRLFTGHNAGYRKSFRRLLRYASEADFYAFADQDDVWMEDKLINAVNMLDEKCSDDEICLYASSDIITNEKLEAVGIHDISGVNNTIQGFYTRARLAGCTFVFSPECKKVAERFLKVKFPRSAEPDHDFLLASVALSCGKVILDKNAYIYHRRTGKNVTSGGNGIIQRLKVEYDLTFKRKAMNYLMADASLRICSDKLSDDAKAFFEEVVAYRKSVKDKLRLLSDKRMKSGVKIGDAETKIKILINQY